VVRKAKAFRGGANKTAPPCETGTGNRYLVTVPVEQLQKMQLQQEKQFSKTNLLRKCGLLAHTSAAFLKNCCTEKLLFACGS